MHKNNDGVFGDKEELAVCRSLQKFVGGDGYVWKWNERHCLTL